MAADKRSSRYFALRFEVLERDNFTCRYCGRSAPSVPLEVDHVKAVVDGGTDTMDNLVACCWSCNRGKEGLRIQRSVARRRRGLGLKAMCPCGEPANTLHFVPWIVADSVSIEVACADHDPGGYWLRFDDLNKNPARWLNHLRQKRGDAHKLLLEWIVQNIGHDANLGSIYEDKPYLVRWVP